MIMVGHKPWSEFACEFAPLIWNVALAHTGLSLLRPMYYQYPESEEAYNSLYDRQVPEIDLDYMCLHFETFCVDNCLKWLFYLQFFDISL